MVSRGNSTAADPLTRLEFCKGEIDRLFDDFTRGFPTLADTRPAKLTPIGQDSRRNQGQYIEGRSQGDGAETGSRSVKEDRSQVRRLMKYERCVVLFPDSAPSILVLFHFSCMRFR